ncbi:MAG: ThiF family adenylyltransferase [Phycisphaeraceae bacterium]|nr:ThiF family adenylyltransferase [Phycisphaeraceae bacterium]
MNQPSDRNLRQRDIIPPEELARSHCTVIGVGAIGRQVALQLAAIDVPWLQLIDHDSVEVVNLAPQGFLHDDLGRPKVQAVGDLCHAINPMLELYEHHERFRRTLEIGDITFCCVDSIQTRRHIWEAVRNRVSFFADGRMTAEVLRVLAVAGQQGQEHYPTTLFDPSEAVQGSCTAKSTIFTANIAAGMMLEQFSRYLRRLPVELDMTLNLLACELTLGNE